MECHKKVLALVKKTKERAEIVKYGILEFNNNTNDRCDKAVEEKIKNVETAKLKYERALEEYQTLASQTESGKSRLNEMTSEYHKMLEENNSLKKTEYALNNQTAIHLDDQKKIDELRLKLKLYKKMTGLRFDFNAPDNVISGYVGVKGLTPSESNVIPFLIQRSEPGITEKLWAKIGEACNETST